MSAQGRQIHADVAEHPEAALEALTRVAFGEQGDDVHVPLVTQALLDRIAAPDDGRPVVLGKVELFQLGIQLDEAGTDPAVERVCVTAHLGAQITLSGPDPEACGEVRGLAAGYPAGAKRLYLSRVTRGARRW